MHRDNGFSLMEVIVALAIVGISASALLGAMTQVTRSGASIQWRLAARDLLATELQMLARSAEVGEGTLLSTVEHPLGTLTLAQVVEPLEQAGLGQATVTVSWQDDVRQMTGSTYVHIAN